MTKTALENKKLEQEKELQQKQFEHERRENRRKNLVGLFGSAVRLFPPIGKGGSIKVGSKERKNDPIWYKKYIADLDKFTNVSTYHRLGTSPAGYYTRGTVGTSTMAIPGIMALQFYDTIGTNISNGADVISKLPINQILMRTKEQILKSNSRSNVAWEASDMGYNIIAATSILSSICDAERALYIAQTYSATNAYLANRLLQAAGWDATQVMSHLAEFRQYLTIIKARFNSSIALPSNLSYTSRKMFLNSNIFVDSDSPAAQLFIFRCLNWYRVSDDGSQLLILGPDRNSPLGWFNQISLMIQLLVENPDFQAMFADLRSAVTDFVTLDPKVDQHAEISFTYDEDFRSQIENMETLPVVITNGQSLYCNMVSGVIRQDTSGYLYQGTEEKTGLQFDITTPDNTFKNFNNLVTDFLNLHNDTTPAFFNMHKKDIDGDDILEITRFRYLGKATTASNGSSEHKTTFTITNSGTEIVRNALIFTLGYNGGMTQTLVGTSMYVDKDQSTDLTEAMAVLSYVNAFDWSPMTRLVVGSVVDPFIDYDVPFTVGNSNVASINDACTLSLLYLDTSIFKR